MQGSYELFTKERVRTDGHRRLLVDDFALLRNSPPLSPPIKASSGEQMVERCVVVQRQNDGYGFTVTGDHPVFVHTVRSDGAAYCAGVRQGDKIIKVNGMPVTSGNHLEVVRMISGGQNVVLTLVGKPPEPLPLHILNESRPENRINDTHSESGKDDWKKRRKELLRNMLNDERIHVENLRGSNADPDKLDRAIRRIEALSAQNTMDDSDDDGDMSVPSVCAPLLTSVESTGPFSNLAELKTHPAHMAVFINYLLTQANPSSLFYYIATDVFQTAQGTPKDFRRWAFEIFTTFIIPNSPMAIPNSDQSIIQPVDKILSQSVEQVSESDVEALKRAFLPGRQRAVADINEHLGDFRQRRALGLGTIFDANQLTHLVRGDNAMEARVGEQMLFRSLEQVTGAAGELEAADHRTQAIAASLATLIKTVITRASTSSWEKMMERCAQFVQKDRAGKAKKIPGNFKSKTQVKGHTFVIKQVNTVHYCYQCRDAVWGMLPWCYFCTSCEVKVHLHCTGALTDACYPASQKQKIVAKPSQSSRRTGLMSRSDLDDGEPPEKPEPGVKSTSSDSGIGQDYNDKTAVIRSQSMKTKATIKIPEDKSRRERTSPSWGNDLPPADEEDEDEIVSRRMRSRERENRIETSCRSFTSLEGSRLASDQQSVSGGSSVSHHSIPDDELRRQFDVQISSLFDDDSDFDVPNEAPPLEDLFTWEVLRHLKPKEKKRQEVINELLHTEKTHLRKLKILQKVFFHPMREQSIAPPEVIFLIFGNLDELVDTHSSILKKMKEQEQKWRRETRDGLFGHIGNLMEDIFGGEQGERLKTIASIYCQHQQHALHFLGNRCKKESTKDDLLVKYLNTAEVNVVCRKQQLKDMLPCEMQRLVKYPMLIENMAKYTQEPSEEQDRLLRAVTLAKQVLSAVNTSKRDAENHRRLEEIGRVLDTSPFDKENAGHDYASLDLTKYRLIHDGPLTFRFNRGKQVELHVVMLERMLVLLTKHNDGTKLQLKTLDPSKETKWSPILPLAPLIAKEKANDKRAFFLVYNSQCGAQIFELVAGTATERKTWFKLLTEQIDHNKKSQTQAIDSYQFELPGSHSMDEGMAKVHVLTHPRLVGANEITVNKPTILEHAQPVLTPMERLKRADEHILQALIMKQRILAQYLPGDKKGVPAELDRLAETLGGLDTVDLKQRESKEVVISSIVLGNRLIDLINSAMRARKGADDNNPSLVLEDQDKNLPSVPCYKLTGIAAPLMNHMKAVMQLVQDLETENQSLKNTAMQYKDLLQVSTADRSVSEETLTEYTDDRTGRKQRTASIQPMT